MSMIRIIWLGLLTSLVSVMVAPASARQQKPNILVIMDDDIGYWNNSAYNRGMMGYRTPNIDRIADEGASSPTTMASSLARPTEPRSLPGRARCAPACSRSGCRERRKVFRTKTRRSLSCSSRSVI
jgi:hypothetical protein